MSQKHTTLWSFLAACLAVFMLSGCGPIYDTRYYFTPPNDPHGQACVFQCENIKLQCEQVERMKEENYNMRARMDQERCRNDIRRHGREPKSSECLTYTSYTANYNHCEAQYRLCYQNCGGKVHTEEVCIFNCN